MDGRALEVPFLDIPQRGVKVRTPFIRPGDEVLVVLKETERRKAVVLWTQAGMAGLNFIKPLSFEELALWVISQQPMGAPNLSAVG